MSGEEKGQIGCMYTGAYKRINLRVLVHTLLGLALCIHIGRRPIDFLLVEVGGGEVPSELTLTWW